MRVNRRGHIVKRRLQAHCRDRPRNDFGRERPNRVNAQNLAVLFLGDNFDKAFVLAEDRRFAIAEEGKFSDFYLVAGFARLFFGQAD